MLKCSKSQKEDLTQPKHRFLTNHSNLTKRCWERSQMLRIGYVSWMAPAPSKGGRGEAFILAPQTSCWKLASKNWNIQFWNRNTQNLKYSRCSPNQMLRCEKSEYSVFLGSERGKMCEAIVFHSSHLGFLGYVEH
jgi:hypothetical protein